MLSKEEFIVAMGDEHRKADREHLYLVYQFLMEQEYINQNFEFEKNFVWIEDGIEKKVIKYIKDIQQIPFWTEINKNKYEELSEGLRIFYKEQGYDEVKKMRDNRLNIILNHMKPISDLAWQIIERYDRKNNKISRRFSYGVYGIYEEGKIVDIGITMEPFEKLKKEKKIDFKILIDVSKIKTNVPITKRDLEAMRLGIKQMLKLGV